MLLLSLNTVIHDNCSPSTNKGKPSHRCLLEFKMKLLDLTKGCHLTESYIQLPTAPASHKQGEHSMKEVS